MRDSKLLYFFAGALVAVIASAATRALDAQPAVMKGSHVNLAPADIRKEGPAYDLPIALGVMAASRQLLADLEDALIVGELGLDGDVRHVDGVLPMAAVAQEKGFKRLFVPVSDAPEAALVEGVTVYPIDSLAGLVHHLNGRKPITPNVNDFSFEDNDTARFLIDFRDVKGQEHIKRALEIA